MMTDYHIQPNTRRCSVSGRILQPGERYYTALIDAQAKWLRQDYALEAWHGPPAGTFSFWSGRVPSGNEHKPPPIDDDMLESCFERLEGQEEPQRVQFRYVLALLLMRRKRLRFEEARSEHGREIMKLRCQRTKAIVEVVNPQLSEDEILSVQEDVFKLLGWQ